MSYYREIIRSDGKIFTNMKSAGTSIIYAYPGGVRFAWWAIGRCIKGTQKTAGGFKWSEKWVEYSKK